MPSQFAANLVQHLNMSKQYFDRSTKVLEEKDSDFAPVKGMMTVAQQVAHTAHTFDWFAEGVSRPEGFDMDFAGHAAKVSKITSLTEARAWLDRAQKNLADIIAGMSDEELYAPLPAGPVMGGVPKLGVVSAVEDHTAHHRGALTVYARALGKTPAMPYMDL